MEGRRALTFSGMVENGLEPVYSRDGGTAVAVHLNEDQGAGCPAMAGARLTPAIAMKAQSRKRPVGSRPAGRAPILIEMISATRAPPSQS